MFATASVYNPTGTLFRPQRMNVASAVRDCTQLFSSIQSMFSDTVNVVWKYHSPGILQSTT